MDGNDWSWKDGSDRGELGADTTPNPAGETPIEGGPPRRTTLDRFNAELAVLDRPLEEDVEYYDDPPPRPTWRRVSATLGAFVLLGAVAAFIVTRWSTPAVANEAESPRPVTVAPAAAAPAPSPTLPTRAPAPVAEEADETADEDAPGLAPPAEPSDTAARGDWTTLQPAGSRHKHGRAAHGPHHHHHHPGR